ncbi:diguanylate cyclase [Myxococcota bacterium]|nr:diguanylate cyclase [Myxococcota bacterium]
MSGRIEGMMNHSLQDRSRVVVVSEDPAIGEIAATSLASHAQLVLCKSATAALEALSLEPADLVISELELSVMPGIELLERVRLEHPDTEFVILADDASRAGAGSNLPMGASECLGKPLEAGALIDLVGRVIARRRLIEENARLRTSLEVFESSRSLVRCLDSGEVYVTALELLLKTLRSHRGLVLFRRPAGPLANGLIFRGFDEGESEGLREYLVGQKPFSIEAVTGSSVAERGPLSSALTALGIEASRVMTLPLAGGDQEAGVIWVLEDASASRWSPLDLESASIIERYARAALENSERYGQAKERAFIDDVTGIYNARYLHQSVKHEIQRAERYGKELSVLFLDLDRFKRVNDEHGHLVGSDVLQRLARVLQGCIRQVDTLARYGGDEFTIVLVDTGQAGARAVAERIRNTVEGTAFEGGREGPIRLTISVGVATYPHHAGQGEQLLDSADKAMYRAKSLGRNQVCSADELETSEPRRPA